MALWTLPLFGPLPRSRVENPDPKAWARRRQWIPIQLGSNLIQDSLHSTNYRIINWILSFMPGTEAFPQEPFLILGRDVQETQEREVEVQRSVSSSTPNDELSTLSLEGGQPLT